MQNEATKTPATATATATVAPTVAPTAAKPAPTAAPAKPAPTKRKRKPTAAPIAAAPAKPADKPKAVHFHADAGLKSRVARMLNANRKTRILHIAPKSPDKLTADKRGAIYDLRAFYAAKPFPARGLDNGILRDLLAARLISVSGGQSVTDNGKQYTLDGDKPAMLTITKAGHAYGKA